LALTERGRTPYRVAYNLRFPGQYYDAETGTHYNFYRDFDPSIGRYLESDPIGLWGGLNTYAYVEQQPLKLKDPLGLWGFFGQGGGSAGGHVGPMGLNATCGLAVSVGTSNQICRQCTVCVRIGPGLYGGAGVSLGGGFHRGNADNMGGWSFGVGFDVGAGPSVGGSGGIGFSGEPFPGQIGDFSGVGGVKGHGGVGWGFSMGLEACRTKLVCTPPICGK